MTSFEDLFQLDPDIWPVIAFSFLRILTVISLIPIFGEKVVPRHIKLLFSILLTLCLWPVIRDVILPFHVTTWTPLTLALATVMEVFFAAFVALISRGVLYAVKISAAITGVQMGFQVANLFNPQTGEQESSFSMLQGWFSLILLLSINYHHILLESLVSSFQLIPIAPVADITPLFKLIKISMGEIFILAMKLSMPLIAVQFLSQMALGLLNRALPQVNVLMLGFPLSFLLCFVILFLTSGAWVRTYLDSGVRFEWQALQAILKIFGKQ